MACCSLTGWGKLGTTLPRSSQQGTPLVPMAGPACCSALEEARQANAPVTNMAGGSLALLASPPGAQEDWFVCLETWGLSSGAGCLCQSSGVLVHSAPYTSTLHRGPYTLSQMHSLTNVCSSLMWRQVPAR